MMVVCGGVFFFFQAEDGIRDATVTGVQTCALPISGSTAAVRLLRHAGGGRDDVLLRPFAEIGDRSLVIVPTAPLQCLLWSVLPSCVGRPLTVAPSATMWHAASRQAAEQR